MKTLLILLTVLNLFKVATTFANERGNGGHPIEMRIKSVLNEIDYFFEDTQNQEDFPEVNFQSFKDVIQRINPMATDEDLKDRFGEPRCLLNDNYVIYVNKRCWEKYLSNEQDHFSIIFHEVLGQIGLEVAGKYVASKYPISARLEKYVKRINRFGLVTPNRTVKLDHITLNCFDNSRSMDRYVYMLISFENKGLNIKVIRGIEKLMNNVGHNLEEFFLNLGSGQRQQIQKDAGAFKRYYSLHYLKQDKASNFMTDKRTNSSYNEFDKSFRINFNKSNQFDFSLTSLLYTQNPQAEVELKEMKKNGDLSGIYSCQLGTLRKSTTAREYWEKMQSGWVMNDERNLSREELEVLSDKLAI